MKEKSPTVQLNGFLAKYNPEIAKSAKAVLAKMRKLLPGAIELVYDNYNALAIGFAPTERASDAIFSIAVYPRWISLFFLQSGTKLSDPKRLLKGSGNKVRHIVLDSVSDLDNKAIRSLMTEALELAAVPFDVAQKNRTVIKSISAKQRPRRPLAQ
jgi:hypothetical protein